MVSGARYTTYKWLIIVLGPFGATKTRLAWLSPVQGLSIAADFNTYNGELTFNLQISFSSSFNSISFHFDEIKCPGKSEQVGRSVEMAAALQILKLVMELGVLGGHAVRYQQMRGRLPTITQDAINAVCRRILRLSVPIQHGAFGTERDIFAASTTNWDTITRITRSAVRQKVSLTRAQTTIPCGLLNRSTTLQVCCSSNPKIHFGV